jgi:hypothetical protein
MAALNKEQILSAQDLKTETVDVPEWGGVVLVRAMTGEERDQYESSVVEQRGKDTRVNLRNARAKLVALSSVDESGAKLFTQADVAALSKKSASALQRVFDVAMRLSGISSADLDELTEEVQENPFGDSPSA